ncbi:hypothetical protein PO909_018753 [Leuciscus waleckii]
MLTTKQILAQIRPGDWFISVDLKDAYFQIQIAPRHSPFLRFAFEGRAYQYTVLPFGLSLAPRTFTKCMDTALAPLRQQGMRILNYLDDWLILAQSETELVTHKVLLLSHLENLGLRINWTKSSLLPSQKMYFLGTEIDSVSMKARPTSQRALSIQRLAASFKAGNVSPQNVSEDSGPHGLGFSSASAGFATNAPPPVLAEVLSPVSRVDLGSLSSQDMLSRGNVPPGEWSLHPQVVQLVWSTFGRAEVDLFASEDNAHCPTYFTKSAGPRLAQSPALCVPTNLVVTTGYQTDQGEQVRCAPSSSALEEPSVVPGADAATGDSPVADPSEEGPPLSGQGDALASSSRAVGPACMGSKRGTVFSTDP